MRKQRTLILDAIILFQNIMSLFRTKPKPMPETVKTKMESTASVKNYNTEKIQDQIDELKVDKKILEHRLDEVEIKIDRIKSVENAMKKKEKRQLKAFHDLKDEAKINKRFNERLEVLKEQKGEISHEDQISLKLDITKEVKDERRPELLSKFKEIDAYHEARNQKLY